MKRMPLFRGLVMFTDDQSSLPLIWTLLAIAMLFQAVAWAQHGIGEFSIVTRLVVEVISTFVTSVLIVALYFEMWRRRAKRLEEILRQQGNAATTDRGKIYFLWADEYLRGKLASARGSWGILVADASLPKDELMKTFERFRGSMQPTSVNALLFFRTHPDEAARLMKDAERRVAALKLQLADAQKRGVYRQGLEEAEEKPDPRLAYPIRVINEAAAAVEHPCAQPWWRVEHLLSTADNLLRAYRDSYGMGGGTEENLSKVRVDLTPSHQAVSEEVETAHTLKHGQRKS